MIYVLVPHTAGKHRYFTTYAAAEQAVIGMARALKDHNVDSNWCRLFAYDGVEELVPVFVYTLVDDAYLHRTTL